MKGNMDLQSIRVLASKDITLALHHLLQYARQVHADTKVVYDIAKLSGTINSKVNYGIKEDGWDTQILQYIDELEKTPQSTSPYQRRELIHTPPKTVFEAKNISKSFTNFSLHSMDMKLNEGEITGVVGENGNGKSTLLKIVSGDLRKDDGSLFYYFVSPDANPANWAKIKSDISYLPQELTRIEGKLEDALKFEASINNITGSRNNLEVDFWITRLGLDPYRDSTWDQLSGGYKLRLSLAKALLAHPKMLILDEPLANLDVRVQTDLLKDLRDLVKSVSEPLTIIMSSLHIELVELIADRIILLQRGKCILSKCRADLQRQRNESIFEIRSGSSYAEFRAALAELNPSRINFDGFAYYVFVPTSVHMNDIFNKSLQNNLAITHISDISDSTKIIVKGYDRTY